MVRLQRNVEMRNVFEVVRHLIVVLPLRNLALTVIIVVEEIHSTPTQRHSTCILCLVHHKAVICARLLFSKGKSLVARQTDRPSEFFALLPVSESFLKVFFLTQDFKGHLLNSLLFSLNLLINHYVFLVIGVLYFKLVVDIQLHGIHVPFLFNLFFLGESSGKNLPSSIAQTCPSAAAFLHIFASGTTSHSAWLYQNLACLSSLCRPRVALFRTCSVACAACSSSTAALQNH